MTVQFKVGDEVEFTRRGKVTETGVWNLDGRPTIRVDNGADIKLYADDRVTLIRAASPVWKKDDVVDINLSGHYATLIFDGAEWRDSTGAIRPALNVDTLWSEGSVKRLVLDPSGS